SVSLTYQDVKRCLVGLQAKTSGQSSGSDGSPETFGQKGDNSLETSINTSVSITKMDSPVSEINSKVRSLRDISPAPSTPSGDELSKRSQEELQAARTILFLAHSGEPLDDSPDDPASSDTEPSTCDTEQPFSILQGSHDGQHGSSRPMKNSLQHFNPVSAEPFNMTVDQNTLTNTANESARDLPPSVLCCAAGSDLNRPPSTSVASPVSSTCFTPNPSGAGTENAGTNCLLTPMNTTTSGPQEVYESPHKAVRSYPLSAIRPPPKKRLSVQYQSSVHTQTAVDSSKNRTPTRASEVTITKPASTVSVSSPFKPTCVSLASPAVSSYVTVVPVTHGLSTQYAPDPNSVKSVPDTGTTQSGFWSPIQFANLCMRPPSTVVLPLASSNTVAAMDTHLSPTTVQSTSLSSPHAIPYANTMTTGAPPSGLFILPQFMVLPRFVGPCVPIVSSQPVVPPSCLVVQPEAQPVRLSLNASTVTDSVVTPIPATSQVGAIMPRPLKAIAPAISIPVNQNSSEASVEVQSASVTKLSEAVYGASREVTAANEIVETANLPLVADAVLSVPGGYNPAPSLSLCPHSIATTVTKTNRSTVMATITTSTKITSSSPAPKAESVVTKPITCTTAVTSTRIGEPVVLRTTKTPAAATEVATAMTVSTCASVVTQNTTTTTISPTGKGTVTTPMATETLGLKTPLLSPESELSTSTLAVPMCPIQSGPCPGQLNTARTVTTIITSNTATSTFTTTTTSSNNASSSTSGGGSHGHGSRNTSSPGVDSVGGSDGKTKALKPVLSYRPLLSKTGSLTRAAAAAAATETLRVGSGSVPFSRLTANRNKYRCCECGMMCHKPCLLRKHYRTHSNVRPYMCQHCDVSFKTRGNLSKHMKSRVHRNRCIQELGFVQAPVIVDDETQVDRQALERQRLLVMRKDHHLHHHHHHRYHHLHVAKREIRETRFRAIRASPMIPGQQTSTGTAISTKITGTSVSTGKSVSTVNHVDGELQSTSHQPCALTSVLRKSSMGRRRKSTRRHYGSATNATRLVSLQPRPVGSIVDPAHGRMPAPNVNAVHLLQDFPLNLSVRPTQPTVLLRYATDPATTASSPLILPPVSSESISATLTTSGTIATPTVSTSGQWSTLPLEVFTGHAGPRAVVSTEAMIQTAIAAARSFSADRSSSPGQPLSGSESTHKELDKNWREVHSDRSTTSTPNGIGPGSSQPATDVNPSSGIPSPNKETSSQTQYPTIIDNQMQLHTNSFSCESNSDEPSSFVDLDEINSKRDRLSRDKVTEQSNLVPCRSRLSSTNTRTTNVTTTSVKPPENAILSSLPVVVAKRPVENQSNRSSPSDRGRQYDPRPYKCSVCNIGFRVMGHLHKHYRAKSHLIMVLQSERLPVDSVDCVRQSRVSTSQIVNPENGQLRPRATERITAMLRQVHNTSTPSTSASSGHSSQHNSIVSPES
ncbi:Transcription factor HIVEP2, partial [Fasciola gigantica]